jgi:hypothetical protein
MALSASTGLYQRTANLPSTSTFSLCFWAMLHTSTAYGNGLFSLMDASNNLFWRAAGAGNDMQALQQGGAGGVNLVTMTLDTWYFFGMSVSSGNPIQHYYAVEGAASLTNVTDWGGMTVSTPTKFLFANRFDTFGGIGTGGGVAFFKFWEAALSSAELLTEMGYIKPQRSTNLHAWYPTNTGADRVTDYSGNGYHISTTGTPSDIDNITLPYDAGGGSSERLPSGIFVPKTYRKPIRHMGV